MAWLGQGKYETGKWAMRHVGIEQMQGIPTSTLRTVLALLTLSAAAWPTSVLAQPVTATERVAADAQQDQPTPPVDSPPVVRTIQIAFPAQGNVPSIEPATYLFYIETRPSRPSENVWLEYDEQRVLSDFRNLWETGFIDDLTIEYNDEPYPNGVIGRNIIYNIEERERVRIVED